MSTPFILALDQGTTGSAAMVFDGEGRVIGAADHEIQQHYPQPGWVEHDPEEIFSSVVRAGREALVAARISAREVAGVGISNQRETSVVWERETGTPIYPAVVWQSRASAEICEALKADGLDPMVREKTGLVIDAYFSATKIRWILDRVPGAQARAEAGDLCVGTIDSWVAWQLTGGRAHVTDVTNASRTLLFNIETCDWDDELCAMVGVPRVMLPRVVASSGFAAGTDPKHFGVSLPIAGLAGDQQAALVGQACFGPGEAKNTYGTGCFLLSHTGPERRRSDSGLLTTLACDVGTGREYALEGSAFTTGAAVQWLRDGLGIISDAVESESLASSIPDNGGVYLVPAFTGLGAPHWDMYARGAILGLTRGATKAHLARATLESIAYQTRDLTAAMAAAGQPIQSLRVDGGGTANAFLMQFQSDLLGIPIEVSAVQESTALGAAYLAGLAVGLWRDLDQTRGAWRAARIYEPAISVDKREALYAQWLRAVERARGWAES